jgi:predicted alpha/beta-hydrolase family hydrolase
VAIDRALSVLGIAVERMDFPYRLAGRRAPDRPPVLLTALEDNARGLAAKIGVKQSRVALGGRSMGGRIASMVVAAGLPASGLVLISYPLHPPGHPEKARTEHLGDISVPCLFISGTKDAFGTPEELEAATSVIPGEVTHVWIEGADHGMRGRDAVVASYVASWLRAPMKRRSPRDA